MGKNHPEATVVLDDQGEPIRQLPAVRDARAELELALRKTGVNRVGLIQRLSTIAAKGEKVVTVYKGEVIESRTVTQDPKIQLDAIDRLSSLLDRMDGMGIKRERHFSEFEYE